MSPWAFLCLADFCRFSTRGVVKVERRELIRHVPVSRVSWPVRENCGFWGKLNSCRLMVQKSGKLTSWYAKYPIIYVGSLHPRWLFGISEPSTICPYYRFMLHTSTCFHVKSWLRWIFLSFLFARFERTIFPQEQKPFSLKVLAQFPKLYREGLYRCYSPWN